MKHTQHKEHRKRRSSGTSEAAPRYQGIQHEGLPPWATRAMRALSTGRYASSWVYEVAEVYCAVLKEEGQEQARTWLFEELSRTIGASFAERLHRAFQIGSLAYRAWAARRRAIGD